MVQRNPLDSDRSTVLVADRREQPAPPWSDCSTITPFDDFALTERLPEQEYFWASEWQEAEREADEDIKARRTKRFSSAQEAIDYLRSSES